MTGWGAGFGLEIPKSAGAAAESPSLASMAGKRRASSVPAESPSNCCSSSDLHLFMLGETSASGSCFFKALQIRKEIAGWGGGGKKRRTKSDHPRKLKFIFTCDPEGGKQTTGRSCEEKHVHPTQCRTGPATTTQLLTA